jgi:hypothetical protein
MPQNLKTKNTLNINGISGFIRHWFWFRPLSLPSSLSLRGEFFGFVFKFIYGFYYQIVTKKIHLLTWNMDEFYGATKGSIDIWSCWHHWVEWFHLKIWWLVWYTTNAQSIINHTFHVMERIVPTFEKATNIWQVQVETCSLSLDWVVLSELVTLLWPQMPPQFQVQLIIIWLI